MQKIDWMASAFSKDHNWPGCSLAVCRSWCFPTREAFARHCQALPVVHLAVSSPRFAFVQSSPWLEQTAAVVWPVPLSSCSSQDWVVGSSPRLIALRTYECVILLVSIRTNVCLCTKKLFITIPSRSGGIQTLLYYLAEDSNGIDWINWGRDSLRLFWSFFFFFFFVSAPLFIFYILKIKM